MSIFAMPRFMTIPATAVGGQCLYPRGLVGIYVHSLHLPGKISVFFSFLPQLLLILSLTHLCLILSLPPPTFLHLPFPLLLMSLFFLLLLNLLFPRPDIVLEVLDFPFEKIMLPRISKSIVDVDRHSAYPHFGSDAGHVRTGCITVMPGNHVVPGLIPPVSHLVDQLIMGVHDRIEELQQLALGAKGSRVVLVLPCQVTVCPLVVLQLTHEVVVHFAINLYS